MGKALLSVKRTLLRAGISCVDERMINAVGCGLDMLLDEINRAFDSLFPLSTGDPGSFERRFRPYVSSLPIEKRREMLKAYMKAESLGGASVQEMKEKLMAAGAVGEIDENYADGVRIRFTSLSESRELTEYIIAKLFPAHIPIYFDYSSVT